MFGLGSKKNEEKDILIRTITELQELRAEISVLKDRLFLVIPDPACVSQESDPAEITGDAQPASPEETASEMSARDQMEDAVNQEGHENTDEKPVMLDETVAGDTVVEEITVQENANDKKEWAVVSLLEARRPWWRFWGPKDRLVRRSL